LDFAAVGPHKSLYGSNGEVPAESSANLPQPRNNARIRFDANAIIDGWSNPLMAAEEASQEQLDPLWAQEKCFAVTARALSCESSLNSLQSKRYRDRCLHFDGFTIPQGRLIPPLLHRLFRRLRQTRIPIDNLDIPHASVLRNRQVQVHRTLQPLSLP
jgi:hypothetical protein